MANKTVIISGANRGIGLAMAKLFRERGDRVVGLCRQASDALRESGVEIIEEVDVTQPDSLRRAAEQGPSQIDVLIANAGVLTNESFDELAQPEAIERIRKQFEVNALGALLTVCAFSPRLVSGSKVALITSRMGSLADNTSGGSYGYRMSKAALNAAGRSLSVDLAPRGIAVGILHPGFVRTEMTAGQGDVEPHEAAAGLLARIDALDVEGNTGRFWHAKGEELPW